MIIECLSSIRKALVEAHEPILQHLFPRLLNNLNNYSTNFRFLSLKIFADIVTQFLSDETIYDITGSNAFSKGMNKMILKQLFPKYGVILSDQDPVPLFGLKLLSVIIEKSPAFITILKNVNLISVVTGYYQVGHKRLNRYTIKIMKHLVESKLISVDDLHSLEIPKKSNEIILNMLGNNQDWCFELILDIIYSLLKEAASMLQVKKDGGEQKSSAESDTIEHLY